MTSGDHQRRQEELHRSPTLRPVEGSVPPNSTHSGPPVTKLLFAFPKRHRGKALELDASHDTLRVLGPRGEEIAVVNSEVALDHLLGCPQEVRTPPRPEGARPLEGVPQRPKRFRVSARGDNGRDYEGLCPVVGVDGLFLELAQAPSPGTQLDLTITSAEEGSRRLLMKGTVAWACPRPDEFGLAPGVGVTCTWHSPELAAFLPDAEAPPSQ